MGNTDIVIEFLELHQPKPYCDDCLSNETRIEPRQQVNQICNRLSNHGISTRSEVNCTICGKLKKCNVLIRREASSNPRGFNEASTQYSIKFTPTNSVLVNVPEMRDQIVRFCREISPADLLEDSKKSSMFFISKLRDEGIIPSHQANMMLTICGLRNSISYENISFGSNEKNVSQGAWEIVKEWAEKNHNSDWLKSTRKE